MVSIFNDLLLRLLQQFDGYFVVDTYNLFFDYAEQGGVSQQVAEMLGAFGSIFAVFFFLTIMLFFSYQIIKICFKGVLKICGLV